MFDSSLELICLQVVNVCMEGTDCTGYRWLPETASQHVHVVHVLIHNDYSAALVTWETGAEVQVPIVGGHSHLQFFARPMD